MPSFDEIDIADLAWTLPDRLTKSLRVSGCGVQEMADYLECNRNTVGSWLAGRTTPSPANLRLWAMKTRVPYQWLKTGKLNDDKKDLVDCLL